jgi:peroxiredoxin
MALPVGVEAPDFTLKSMAQSGLEDIKLSSNFGVQATVLLFFPFAFTGVCTQEMCDITAGLGRYKELNADVIGISVDSPFAQDAWAKRENISIKLASDLNKEVINAYDVVFKGIGGIGDAAARAAFVIGRDGIIYYSEQMPTPKELPSFEKIEQILSKLSL